MIRHDRGELSQQPTGEFVELDFYFGKRGRADSFRNVVEYCCTNGGTFAQEVMVSEGPGIRNRRYTYYYCDPVCALGLHERELWDLLCNPNVDTVKVAIWSAIGVTTRVPEIITYSGVSEEASKDDNAAVAIISEAYGKEPEIMGRLCYEKFVGICNTLEPEYAAILNEDSLPCRQDLQSGMGNRCFLNFFVSEHAHSPRLISEIEQLFRDAYVEKMRNGIYISTWPDYNPKGCGVDMKNAVARSKTVAELLALAET